jgi:hypothetical protein
MTPAQQLALQMAMHLDALSEDELLALEDAIMAEKKRRWSQRRQPPLVEDLRKSITKEPRQ